LPALLKVGSDSFGYPIIHCKADAEKRETGIMEMEKIIDSSQNIFAIKN